MFQVIFSGNHYVFLPYKVKSQTTKVTLASTSIEQYSKLKPTSQVLNDTCFSVYAKLKFLKLPFKSKLQSDKSITYGPYTDIGPFSSDEMTVHFENNNPFLVVSRYDCVKNSLLGLFSCLLSIYSNRMERIIELSMWGNIAIEESLDVRHAGAKLKGTFSRYEYQKDNSGLSSVKSFKTVLPASGMKLLRKNDDF